MNYTDPGVGVHSALYPSTVCLSLQYRVYASHIGFSCGLSTPAVGSTDDCTISTASSNSFRLEVSLWVSEVLVASSPQLF